MPDSPLLMPQQNRPARCRLLVDPPSGGAWQMAVDEALLESAASQGTTTLRFYQWAEPTLSLGYFQRYEERQSHRASRDCAVVRRQTGGGAILHDLELTYSLALPVAHPLASDATRLYRSAHDALLAALARFEVEATLCGGAKAAEPEPFLCFQRRSTGDVLMGESKICGSAQRRRRGAILQHGSLLLERSEAAPELPGIREQLGKPLDLQRFLPVWQAQLAAHLDLELEAAPLTHAEQDQIRTLTLEKYHTRSWTERR